MISRQFKIFNKTTFTIFILTLLFFAAAHLPLPWNDTVENGFVELQFKLRGSRHLSDEILFVFIGAEDVQSLGGWPIT